MGNFVRSKVDVLMFVYGAIEVFFFGGITYGWPNLVRALKGEKYFNEYCDISVNSTLTNSTALEKCPEQDDMFGMVYNIASVITGIGNILIGTAVDRFPMFATRLLFISFFLIGSLCTAFSSPESPMLLIPGMLFIRIGGFLFYYANMRLANAAPRIKGTIITVYAGLFDSSSSVLYIILIAYQNGFPVQKSFMIFAIGVVAPLIFTLLLFPFKSINQNGTFERFPQFIKKHFDKSARGNETKSEFDDVNLDENGSTNTGDKMMNSEPDKENDQQENVEPEVIEHSKFKNFLYRNNLSFLLDAKFYLFLLLLSVLTLRKEFFVISYDAALVKSAEGDPELVDYYTAVFGITQFFAILVTPLGGLVIDYSRSRGSLMAYVPQFGFTLLCGALLCVCSFIEHIKILYLSNILYVVCRALTYSIAAAYISDTYPMKMFGSILGTTESVGYLLSLLQYPIFAWSNGPLDQNYKPANGIILALCLIATIHPIRLFFHYRKTSKEIDSQPNHDNEGLSIKL